MDFHVKIAKDKRGNRRLGSRGKSSLFQCTRKPLSKSFRVIGKASEGGAKYAGIAAWGQAILIFRQRLGKSPVLHCRPFLSRFYPRFQRPNRNTRKQRAVNSSFILGDMIFIDSLFHHCKKYRFVLFSFYFCGPAAIPLKDSFRHFNEFSRLYTDPNNTPESPCFVSFRPCQPTCTYSSRVFIRKIKVQNS